MNRQKDDIKMTQEKKEGNMHDVEVTMISIPYLSKRWGCSRNFIWDRCKTKEIPATKIGDRWFIPMWWVKEQESVPQV